MPFRINQPFNTLFTWNLHPIRRMRSIPDERQRGRKLRGLVLQTRKALPALPPEAETMAGVESRGQRRREVIRGVRPPR
jgi:hypothetical protein